MNTTIAAIETSYAGCRFRSRLEARWAHAFNMLGIRWQYEPQGYEIDVAGVKRPYLPDFWLPDTEGGIWCEVKGSPEGLDVPLLAYACRPEGGLPDDLAGRPVQLARRHRMLILGPVPPEDPRRLPLHCVLTCERGGSTPGVYATAAIFLGCAILGTDLSGPVLGPDGTIYQGAAELWPRITGEQAAIPIGLAHVYRAARTARFEYGETPVSPAETEPHRSEPVSVGEDLRTRLAEITANRKPDPEPAA